MKKNENTTDWYDKNKFKKILAIINSNKFNHKNKTGKFKYNDIIRLINNINNDTNRETLAKENLDALNKIKKAEIKNKGLISTQEELLNLFHNLLEAISNNNNDDDETENATENKTENGIKNVIENNNNNNINNNNDNNNNYMHRKIRAFSQLV